MGERLSRQSGLTPQGVSSLLSFGLISLPQIGFKLPIFLYYILYIVGSDCMSAQKTRPKYSGKVRLKNDDGKFEDLGTIALWENERGEGDKRPVLQGNAVVRNEKIQVSLWKVK
jgi:hypothetical protein